MTSPHDTVLAMMARGREFLGTEYAIMGGAMSWISERNLVSAISNAGASVCPVAKPRKAGDKRARYIDRTVEAEAMPAKVLRQLLVDNIEALLPPDAVAAALMEEESARDYFDVLAGLREREA